MEISRSDIIKATVRALTLHDPTISDSNRITRPKISHRMIHTTPYPSYITFSSEFGDFSIRIQNGRKNWDGVIEYSTDIETWVEWDGTGSITSVNNNLYLRGTNNTVITGSSTAGFVAVTNYPISCNGNLETLLDYEKVNAGVSPRMGDRCFCYAFSSMQLLISAPLLQMPYVTSGCYEGMFRNCTGLTIAPELPATVLWAPLSDEPDSILADDCYRYMFQGCTNLTTPPNLPATHMGQRSYESMFQGCTGLTMAPELPATNLALGSYRSMFQGCTSLTTPPALNSSTTSNCYESMFRGCTSLTAAPRLPDTNPAPYCYSRMFQGCTRLTTAFDFQCNIIQDYAFSYMFYGCTRLTTAPNIRASLVFAYGCQSMFQGCTSLTTAPVLSANFLGDHAYASMFYGCSWLTTPPSLPATSLETSCYSDMFRESALTKLPYLPATTLPASCYMQMFMDCKSIKLSTTQNATYQYPYRIPYSGYGMEVTPGSRTGMFFATGGTFTGTPALNTTYYTNRQPV